MRLDHTTWQEVEDYLKSSDGILVPTGSTEQHGPMGLIGTDAICAEQVAMGAGERADALVAPTLAYTPAPFNMDFPGTISLSVPLFEALLGEILECLDRAGFRHIYFINGHGANLDPLRRVAGQVPALTVRIRSWWDFEDVNDLRQNLYGEWEGMHATPSEIAITQATHRTLAPGDAVTPPVKLSAEYIRRHSGDRHGPADAHRKQFPDGRVGSHSALANPRDGFTLLEMAQQALSNDYRKFLET